MMEVEIGKSTTTNPISVDRTDSKDLSMSSKPDETVLDRLVNAALYQIKRAIGGYYYYQVFTIFLRPVTLFLSAVLAFITYFEQTGSDDASRIAEIALAIVALVFAILAFTFSFPFLVAKSEEASYMVKIHYPFLMSKALGLEQLRTVMLDVLQNMREQAAILTLLLGSATELLLIFGNWFLFLASTIHGGGGGATAIAIVAFMNLGASLYSFYCYCVYCMKIMVYKAHGTFVEACCVCCFGCVSDDCKSPTDLVKMDLDLGDTKKFYSAELVMPFKSKKYSEKYTLKITNPTGEDLKEPLDVDAVQKDVIAIEGKPIYDIKDRYGLLSITGDAHLLVMERKDKIQAAKEEAEANGGSDWGFGALCSMIGTLICQALNIFNVCTYILIALRLFAMYWISALYALTYGVCYAFEWFFCGFGFEDQLEQSCQTVAEKFEKASNCPLSPREISDMKDGTKYPAYVKKHYFTKISRQMPWGFAFLAPISKTECIYKFAKCINPLPNCRTPYKFVINSKTITDMNTVASYVLRCDAIIPHKLFSGFPFTYWPLDNWHDGVMIAIGRALQALRDAIETHYLKTLGLEPDADGKVTPAMIEAIKELRSIKPPIEQPADDEESSQGEDLANSVSSMISGFKRTMSAKSAEIAADAKAKETGVKSEAMRRL